MSIIHKASAGAVLVILSIFVAPTSAKSFLRQPDTREEVEASLMAELAGTFRPSASKDHIISLEVKLQAMYTAVPQNADGTLPHAVVRYILHRFFAQRGWFIRGLEPAGNASNTTGGETSNTTSLQEWVPTFLQNFLEQLAGGRGISLRELAVLAATLEDLIHKEAVSRLQQAFESLELPLDSKLDEQTIKEVLEVYMMIYQLGGKFGASGKAAVRRAHQLFTEKIKDWGQIQEWMGSVKQSIHPTGPLDFNATARIVEAIGEQYGTYNIKECTKLKSELLDVESKKAGRVSLTEFYKKGLTGVFEFNEKIDYLRVLGAADESDRKQPYVIIPNYVSARPNCMVASSFYAICCRNECEELMGKLEGKFANEMAAPEEILGLVATLPSDTVEAPRKLSASLMQRLHGIAKSNGGEVPLHGRLFAQWMHHAFPRECPYPHEAGSTNPQTPDEWMEETGQQDSKLSKEELVAHVKDEASKCTGSGCSDQPKGAEARKHHHFEENELPWNEAEELLLPAKVSQRQPFRYELVFLALSCMVLGLVWFVKSFLLGAASTQPSKGVHQPQCGSPDVFKLA